RQTEDGKRDRNVTGVQTCALPISIGIGESFLDTAREYLEDRIGAQGTAIKDDPYVLYQLGDAEAKVYQARQALIANAEEIWEIVDRGDEVGFDRRAQGRRTQVDVAWTAVRAIDNVYDRCGGTALRMDKPMQRFWRDA